VKRSDVKRLIRSRLEHNPANPQTNIAVAGGSGSGKTTFTKYLDSHLHGKVTIVSLDEFFKEPNKLPKYFSNYHKDFRPDYNNPKSLKLKEMLEYCQNISGYDFVIFDGHFALYYPGIRELMGLKIFIELEIGKQLERRSKRNLAKAYGGTKEEIYHYNLDCVLPGYNNFIKPSKQFADIVINNDGASIELDKTAKYIAEELYSIHSNTILDVKPINSRN